MITEETDYGRPLGPWDSYGLMWGLMMKAKAPIHFDLVAFHLDQGQPNYDGHPMERFMTRIREEHGIEGEIEPRHVLSSGRENQRR